MKKIILGLLVLSSASAFADCDTIRAATEYVKTNTQFSEWVGGPVSNIRFSNIPEAGSPKNKQILVVVDYKNQWSSGTLSNMLIVDRKTCEAKLDWSANLNTLP